MNPQEQRRAALVRANTTRLARARIKRSLYAGTMSLSVALSLSDCQRMRVFDLIRAQRQWGRKRTLKALNVAAGLGGVRISESKIVEDLTVRQRDALVRVCGGESSGRVAA